jgi:DNA-binding transcriptional ArsR family regulator
MIMTCGTLGLVLGGRVADMAKSRHSGLIDQRLAKALSHPMRTHILAILNEQVASPNEIADMLGERLPNVSYHVRVLLDLGCLELVRTAQRRGAIEHFYRALKRPFFSDRDWKRLPPSGRRAVSDVALQMVWEDVAEAVDAGTFDARLDRHLSRSPFTVDEKGWGELHDLLAKTLEEAQRIAARSATRLMRGEGTGIPSEVVLMHFESPLPRTPGRRRAGPARKR